MTLHSVTGWLRRNQLRLITAIQATLALLVAFGVADFTETQIAAIIAVATAWLAVAGSQNVDTRELAEWADGQ